MGWASWSINFHILQCPPLNLPTQAWENLLLALPLPFSYPGNVYGYVPKFDYRAMLVGLPIGFLISTF